MPQLRKNVKDLTADEKKAFIKAVLTLKRDSLNKKKSPLYNELVAIHATVMDIFQDGNPSKRLDIGHRVPSFLPWHRNFLLMFEKELQSVDPDVTLPYWDWADAESTAAVFSADFMGTPVKNGTTGAVVKDGPFKQGEWETIDGEPLKRNVGSVQSLLKQTSSVYKLITWRDPKSDGNSFVTFAGALEKHHDFIHMWVGGHMGSINTAVNDPVFWLNHCNVDRLWAMWQDFGNMDLFPKQGYSFGNNAEDALWPWDGGKAVPEADRYRSMIADADPKMIVKNNHMLDHRAFRYAYDILKGELTPTGKPLPEKFVKGEYSGHIFTLNIKTGSKYDIFTTGETDVEMQLYGPAQCDNCFGAERGHDDNSGEGGINAKISITLQPGKYFVTVRPVVVGAIGSYNVTCTVPTDQPVKLIVGQRIKASIAQMWETDWYQFKIDKEASYVVETTGKTDTMLTLYGEHVPDDWITTDEDSGTGNNAMIIHKLKPGIYHVAVRAQRRSIGSYTIIVRI